MQRLPIEPISQASANQRKGRCGRVADGICIRLYSEEDFLARPEFTEPEILRTNLASVILQMAALGLGDVEAFPFVDPPDRRSIADGLALLHELGALDPTSRTRASGSPPTAAGWPQLPRRPALRPHAARGRPAGLPRARCWSSPPRLSIQDPRERPADKQQAADAVHARFADEHSDFLAYLNLWRYLGEQQKALSSNQFRRMCRREYLHYLRIREWQDLHGQLRAARPASSGCTREPARRRPDDAAHHHRAAGRPAVPHRRLRDPAGRQRRLPRPPAAPASRSGPAPALARKQPRVGGGGRAGRDPPAVGPHGRARSSRSGSSRSPSHLVKRTYSEPHWEKKRGSAVAYERVTLYGVPIVASRKVQYGRIDPSDVPRAVPPARAGRGRLDDEPRVLRGQPASCSSEVEELEDRARRRDIVVDDETLYAFYDARIPADVVSARHFDSWWKKARRARPGPADVHAARAARRRGPRRSDASTPTAWNAGPEPAVGYAFEPGADGRRGHRRRPARGAEPRRAATSSTGTCRGGARSSSPR